jgi:hypothetical protein
VEIKIANRHTMAPGETGEYIGRGSVLGNPWPITPGRTREQAISTYRAYLRRSLEAEDPDIMREMMRLLTIAQQKPLTLVCFCAPLPCHGEVIREALLSCDSPEG